MDKESFGIVTWGFLVGDIIVAVTGDEVVGSLQTLALQGKVFEFFLEIGVPD